MQIEPIQPEYREGDDVVIKLTHPVGTGDPPAHFRWLMIRTSGKEPTRIGRLGRVTFTENRNERQVHAPKRLRRGNYRIHLWREFGDINDDADVEALVGGGSDASLPFTVGAIPGIKAYLTKKEFDTVVDVNDPCASYGEFADRVDLALNPLGGIFGPANYEIIRQISFDFASQCHCRSIFDLAPTGYEQDRKDSEPFLPDKFGDISVLPCVELIWNYWEEEGMLVQTLSHILARLQNRRVGEGFDPLARFDISPLLPLRNLLWGWAEDEQRRLTVRRRNAEYQYEYGLTLIGRAIPPTSSLVERRTGFLQAFHTILHQAHVFYKELDDLTVNADAFPLYQSLRECHLILSQGSQNQYGEMAVAARAEMLTMQYLLAQAPMREFLGGRPMTPYPEPWMDRVDTMKTIQGWADTSVMHFHDLATIGEKLVLTIRLGNWADPAAGSGQAAIWATAFRPYIQKYAAAYRAVTGVDLSQGVDATMPSTLIARRIEAGRRRA